MVDTSEAPSPSPRALLVHGLASNAATWWRVADALAADGWAVTAVDLRGHGDAPLAETYEFAGYASDLPAGPWDLVVGHSLGGAVAVVAQSGTPAFARRLVLIDPALVIPDDQLEPTLASELDDLDLTVRDLAAAKPHWHPRDIELKAAAADQAGSHMVVRTVVDNSPWDVTDRVRAIDVPTLVLGGDPAVYSMVSAELGGGLAAANPLVDYRTVAGTGHSPHRDSPDAALAVLREWLAATA